MNDIRRCAVIGCGFVGSATAFTLMNSGLFNEIILIDVDHKKAEGEAMDLNHGMPYSSSCNIFAGTYTDIKNSGIIIIAAGANQKPGETRIDLLNKNAAILKSIVPEIVKNNPDCIMLVVSNPVDILTYITLKISGFPKNRVIGSGTVLDTARLKYLLGQHLNVSSKNVHTFILGEHGDSEFPVWSSANISGIDLEDFCKDCHLCKDMYNIKKIFEDVKNSAYEIIERKGATYYAIALSVLKICQALVKDQRSVLPVSSLIQNHYGLDDVCLALPTIVGKKGIQHIIDIPLNEEERKKLVSSADILKELINQIKI